MKSRDKGTHTWDIVVRYHRCPACGTILESRDDYTYRFGMYVKQLTCLHCGHAFTDTRRSRPDNQQPVD